MPKITQPDRDKAGLCTKASTIKEHLPLRPLEYIWEVEAVGSPFSPRGKMDAAVIRRK